MKDFTTDLCDSLLENLFNANKNHHENLAIWKNHRNNPEIVLKMAFENMSIDQKYIFELVTKENNDSGRKIYMLAGLPGTGKSFLQTSINLFFQNAGKQVMCLAPTNLIAYQQKGTTIHKKIYSLCKNLNIKHFKCDSSFIEKLVKKKCNDICGLSLTQLCDYIKEILNENGNLESFHSILSKDIIILIDEGTMVSSILFSLLYYTYPNATYVIMYGPNQLPPPVSVKGINISSCDYCISKEKEETILFYELTSQMRFNSDNLIFIEYVQYLSHILSGKMTKETMNEKLEKLEYFFENLKYGGNLKDYNNLTGDSKRILIVSTNQQRCQENNERLHNEGSGPVYEIPTERPPTLPDSYDLPSRIGIDNVLRIRKDVYCIVRINDLCLQLIKGQIVKIIGIITNEKNEVVNIKVYNLDTKEFLTLSKMEIPTDFPDNKEECLTVRQFPITLSYSLTAHSAQGKTLNCNIGIKLKHYMNNININSYFVAITRVRDSKQLFMDNHPASLLHYDMNIKSIKDVEKLKKNLYDNHHHHHHDKFQNYVNNFEKKKLPLGDNDEMLIDINNTSKKICRLLYDQ